MLRVAYDHSSRRAICSWDEEDRAQEWARLLKRTLQDHTDSLEEPALKAVSVPWWLFLSARRAIQEIIVGYEVPFEISPEAEALLRRSIQTENSYQDAVRLEPTDTAHILEKIRSVGFTRTMTDAQLRNVQRIAALSAAATFSVPGAGKTTEAIAYFCYRSGPSDKLLVVAPKNAFGSWDEQLLLCVPDPGTGFVRLRGGRDRIAQMLEASPRLMLITYHQLNNVRDLIAGYLLSHRTFVFLDESHRIKGGKQLKTPEAVLSLSHLPAGKLLMSGTPMPQAYEDLVPQFNFLYPELKTNAENVVDLIQPVYVRTTKAELNLPEPERRLIILRMAPAQEQLYMLMRKEVARLAELTISARGRAAFRRLGRSIMRLLMCVSNPALLASEVGLIHQDYLAAVLSEEGVSPKIEFACRRARELAKSGRKVLIWTSFVNNVEIVANRLADLGAVFIHGGVDAGDDDDEDTREGKIKIFHDRPDVMVMVANPAAASEGISLHKVCRNAIYIDRTYNAAHYIQSEDRIHRLGLAPGEYPTIEILECRGTIDESVRTRLGIKVDRMARALNDASLNIDPLPYDPLIVEDEEEFVLGPVDEGDVIDLIRNLKDGTG